jgi:hypothetical protein
MTMVTESAKDLRQRAADTRKQVRGMSDRADMDAIRAELIDARRSVEETLRQASAAAERASAVFHSALRAHETARHETEKLRQQAATMHVVKAGSDSRADKIQARALIPAIEAELQDAQAELAEATAVLGAAREKYGTAEARKDECAMSLKEFDLALKDPLGDPLAKVTQAYKERIGRGAWWILLMQNAGDAKDMEYAKAMLQEVCLSEYGAAIVRGIHTAGAEDQRALTEQQSRLADLAQADWAKAQQKKAVQDAITRHARDEGASHLPRPETTFQPGLRAE